MQSGSQLRRFREPKVIRPFKDMDARDVTRLIEIAILLLGIAFSAGAVMSKVDELSAQITAVETLSAAKDRRIESQLQPIRQRMQEEHDALTRIEDMLCYRFPSACSQIERGSAADPRRDK